MCRVCVCVKWPSVMRSLLRVDALNPEGMAPMADSTSVASICYTHTHTQKHWHGIRTCVNGRVSSLLPLPQSEPFGQWPSLMLCCWKTGKYLLKWTKPVTPVGNVHKQGRDAEPLFLSKFRQLFTVLLFIVFWQVFIITLRITLVIFIGSWSSLKENESFNWKRYQCWTFQTACYLNRSRKCNQEMPSNGFSAEDHFPLGEFTEMRSCVPSERFLEPLLCCLYGPEPATNYLLTSW